MAKSLGLARLEIDTEGLVDQAQQLAQDSTGLISIFTLVSLLRYPMIHSPQEKQTRASLAQVSSQLEQDEMGCQVVYLAGAKELLQDPVVMGGTDSPAGDVAVASDVAIASAPGAAAPRASPAKPKPTKATAAPKARGPKRATVNG